MSVPARCELRRYQGQPADRQLHLLLHQCGGGEWSPRHWEVRNNNTMIIKIIIIIQLIIIQHYRGGGAWCPASLVRENSSEWIQVSQYQKLILHLKNKKMVKSTPAPLTLMLTTTKIITLNPSLVRGRERLRDALQLKWIWMNDIQRIMRTQFLHTTPIFNSRLKKFNFLCLKNR